MKTRCVTSMVIAIGLVIANMPAHAAEKKAKSATGFWADARDDFYHLSNCTHAHRPLGAQLIAGSELDLIALGYYPDPACLPNRSIATRAGRVVRVEGGAFTGAVAVEEKPSPLPEPPKNDSGFPGLAPGEDKKPNDAKPDETKPVTPTNPFGGAATEPAKPKPATGFPTPPNTGGFPSPQNLGGGQPSNPGQPAAGTERRQTTATRGAPVNQSGGRMGQQQGGRQPSGGMGRQPSGGRSTGGGRTSGGGARGGRR